MRDLGGAGRGCCSCPRQRRASRRGATGVRGDGEVCQSGCPYSAGAGLAAAQGGDTIESPRHVRRRRHDRPKRQARRRRRRRDHHRGGGPVLTIGAAVAPSEPTVTIRGATVTGGVTIGNSPPESGRGGGIYIPRAAGPSTGATVTIRDSVIRGNSVAPRVAIDPATLLPVRRLRRRRDSNDGTLTSSTRRSATTGPIPRPGCQQRDRRRNPQPRLWKADGQAQRRHAQPRRRDPTQRPLRRRRRHRGQRRHAHDHRQPGERQHRRHALRRATASSRRRPRAASRSKATPRRRSAAPPSPAI